jgi:hypothetical protein
MTEIAKITPACRDQRAHSATEYGLAIDGDISHFDHGSWLTVRVVSAKANPPA